jgi:hypothetical protein
MPLGARLSPCNRLPPLPASPPHPPATPENDAAGAIQNAVSTDNFGSTCALLLWAGRDEGLSLAWSSFGGGGAGERWIDAAGHLLTIPLPLRLAWAPMQLRSPCPASPTPNPAPSPPPTPSYAATQDGYMDADSATYPDDDAGQFWLNQAQSY